VLSVLETVNTVIQHEVEENTILTTLIEIYCGSLFLIQNKIVKKYILYLTKRRLHLSILSKKSQNYKTQTHNCKSQNCKIQNSNYLFYFTVDNLN